MAAKYLFAGLCICRLHCRDRSVGSCHPERPDGAGRWVPGTPLRERRLRDQERAALNAVAMTWGFRHSTKHDEEEGKAWEFGKA